MPERYPSFIGSETCSRCGRYGHVFKKCRYFRHVSGEIITQPVYDSDSETLGSEDTDSETNYDEVW